MVQTRCQTAAMLEVGMIHEADMQFSHEQVRQYCELAGDHNAIHRDVAAARLRFPDVSDIIVPGGLIQISITGLFGSVLPGDGSLGLTFTPERMRKPVCPGERIRVRIELTRLRSDMAEFDINIADGAGARIGSARSRLIAPDKNYYDWWQQQQTAAAS